MERQTLQQEAPVYHVCQVCAGAGCAACAQLCILEGDIDFNVDEFISDIEIELDPDWSGELPEVQS
ncbi:hypothetical protein [Aeromonas taiwanensis]|uniref:hypothetical protein n=1 Tax=Aeromonas taiwanensis TaxID=633417 RepID=UPI00248F0F85|nr:hypothetical protein [Aeromonas taiwanensis]